MSEITFTSDVDSHARANNLLGVSKQKFQKLGREIVVYESAPVSAKTSSGGGAVQKILGRIIPAAAQSESVSDATSQEQKQKQGPTERVVFRELDTVTLGEGAAHYQRHHLHRVEIIEELVSSENHQSTVSGVLSRISQAIPMQIS